MSKYKYKKHPVVIKKIAHLKTRVVTPSSENNTAGGAYRSLEPHSSAPTSPSFSPNRKNPPSHLERRRNETSYI